MLEETAKSIKISRKRESNLLRLLGVWRSKKGLPENLKNLIQEISQNREEIDSLSEKLLEEIAIFQEAERVRSAAFDCRMTELENRHTPLA